MDDRIEVIKNTDDNISSINTNIIIKSNKCWEIFNNNNINVIYCNDEFKFNEFPVLLPVELKVLICNNNNIIELPILPNNIIALECNYNKLTHITNIYDKDTCFLERLLCNHNNIYIIDISRKLKNIYAQYNYLYYITQFYEYIKVIDFTMNIFTDIPQIFNHNITYYTLDYFSFTHNPIKYINIHTFNMIKQLYQNIKSFNPNKHKPYLYLYNTPFNINYCNTYCNDKYCTSTICDLYQQLFEFND